MVVKRQRYKVKQTGGPSKLQDFYRSSDVYMRSLEGHETNDYFGDYLTYVGDAVPGDSRVLDIGCGTGFSSAALTGSGFRTVGIDCSQKFLTAGSERHSVQAGYVVGEALKLPFREGAFDAVASYNFLEHSPDVEESLVQMARVLRPGGLLLVMAPNMLSPYRPLKYLVQLLRGGGGLPTFYETPWACIRFFFWSLGLLLWKRLSRRPVFLRREPVLDNWIDADADCAYWANPVDLLNYFRQRRWEVVRYQGTGQTKGRALLARLTPDLGGLVAVTVRKPTVHKPCESGGR